MLKFDIPDKKHPIRGELFDSIYEFNRLTKERPNNVQGQECKSSHKNDRSFTGTSSYEEAENLMANGWEEPLAQLMQGFATAMKVRRVESRTRANYRNHIVGCTPVVPRAILGLPDSMRQVQRQPMKSKTLSFYYDIAAHCGTATTAMTAGGVTFLTMVATLEKMGFRCRVYCGAGVQWSSYGVYSGIMLKDYADPLDLKKMCFPLAHPSMLRRIMFRFYETTPVIDCRDYGYGRPFNNDENTWKPVIRAHTAKTKGFYLSLSDCQTAKHNVDTLMVNLGIAKLLGEEAAA